MNDESLALEHGTLTYLRGGKGPLVVFSHALGPLAWGPLDRLMGSSPEGATKSGGARKKSARQKKA